MKLKKLLLKSPEDKTGGQIKNETLVRFIVGVLITGAVLIFFSIDDDYILSKVSLGIFNIIAMVEIIRAADLTHNTVYLVDLILISLMIIVVNIFTDGLGRTVIWTLSLAISIALFLYLMTGIKKRQPGFFLTAFICLVTAMLIKSVDTLTFTGRPFFYKLFALIGCYASDIAAYIFGRAFGKRKIFPSLSPKKTVVGCVAALVSTPIIMIGFCLVFQWIGLIQVDMLSFAFYALFISLFAQFGDLSFSSLKRACGVKDFGNALPGHGGFLDRFDSFLFTSTYTLVFISIFGEFLI